MTEHDQARLEQREGPVLVSVGVQSNNPSWRHHYVPQFYLRQWTTEPDKALWCYERLPTGKLVERRVVPKSTGYGEHLYTYRHAFPFMHAEPPDVIEKSFFQDIDDNAAKALAALLANETLDPADEHAWALFLCSMLHRGASELAELDAQAPALVEETFNRMRAMGKTPESRASMAETLDRMDVRAVGRNSVREHMIREIKDSKHVDYLKRCKRRVVDVASDSPLITSDIPLIVNLGESERPVQVVTFALSPAHLFVLWNLEKDFASEEAFRHTASITARAHNFMHCEGKARYLYSRDRIVDAPQKPLRTAVETRFGVPPQSAARSAEGLSDD